MSGLYKEDQCGNYISLASLLQQLFPEATTNMTIGNELVTLTCNSRLS